MDLIDELHAKEAAEHAAALRQWHIDLNWPMWVYCAFGVACLFAVMLAKRRGAERTVRLIAFAGFLSIAGLAAVPPWIKHDSKWSFSRGSISADSKEQLERFTVFEGYYFIGTPPPWSNKAISTPMLGLSLVPIACVMAAALVLSGVSVRTRLPSPTA